MRAKEKRLWAGRSAGLITILVLKAKPERVKGYLWFRVVVIKVVVGAVVGVVCFIQQLDCQRPAEGLRHKGVLEDRREREPMRAKYYQ